MYIAGHDTTQKNVNVSRVQVPTYPCNNNYYCY